MKLIKLKIAKSAGLLFVATLLSNSCTDQQIDVQQNLFKEHPINVSDKLYKHIVNDLRFDPSDVVDYGEMYVAEGDLMFNKSYYVIPDNDGQSFVSDENAALPFGVNASSISNGRTHQHVAWMGQRVHATSTQSNISVSIHSNIATSVKYNIRPQIQQAFDKWNNVMCSNIRFNLVTGQRGRIQISDGGNMTGSTPGSILLDATDYPSGGLPGRNLKLNVHAIIDDSFRAARTVGIILHSLGHAVGFRHNNESLPADWPASQGNVLVPQTPRTDQASVFNAGIPSSNEFSSNDKVAIANVYPSYLDAACLAPFYYYFSSPLADAFYTTQLSAKGEALTPGWNYTYQKIECFIHTVQVTGTVPIYQMWSQGNSDHAYKLSSATFSSYSSQGVAGYIYSSSAVGRVSLHEFYNSSVKDYAYTVNPNSISSSSGYVNQGIIGYVYTTR